jgi:hypothetical protein
MKTGRPYYSHYGVGKTESNFAVRIGEQLIDVKDLENADRVWSETEIDLSGHNTVSEVNFSMTTSVVKPKNAIGYDWLKFESFFDYIVCITNTSSRKRTMVLGKIKKIMYANAKQPVRYEGTISDHMLDLSDFSGVVTLEPMFVVKNRVPTGKLLDTKSNVSLLPGSVVSYSDPFKLYLERDRQGFMGLFEFVWRSFSTDTTLDLPKDGFFSINWGPTPQIILNKDIENLETVLTSEAKVGRTAAVRDALNRTIAHQVLTSALESVIAKILKAASESEDLSPDELISGLENQERQMISSWSGVVDPSPSNDDDLKSVVQHILDTDDFTMRAFLIKELPERLQKALDTQVSSSRLIDLLKYESDDADGA